MLKKVFFIVIAVLVLQVIKVVLIKASFRFANFSGILIMALQFYLAMAPIVYWLVSKLIVFVRNAKIKKLLALSVTVIFFVALEMLFAFYLNNPRSIPQILQNPVWLFYEKYDFRIIQYEKNHGVYDSDLFYRLNPNARFVFKNREFADSFYINSKGLRDDEQSLTKPDIICLGDSYFMGWGISQDSTFAAQLQKKSKLRVLNAAISSYGTVRELKLLKKLDTSAVKFVVLQYCVNDWIENKYYLSHHQQLKISPQKQFEAEQFEHYLSRLYFPGRYSSMLGHLLMKFAINKIYPVFNLPYDRNLLVSDEAAQASDFLKIIQQNWSDFGSATLLVTLMDSEKRIDNRFLFELEKLLREPTYMEISRRIRIIHTEKLFNSNDFYLLDQHARATAYSKLSSVVLDSLSIDQP